MSPKHPQLQAPRKKRQKLPQKTEREKKPEPLVQFTLQMRASLHRELAQRALNSGMTMRGYIMNALRKSGLKVTDNDLVDRRRREAE